MQIGVVALNRGRGSGVVARQHMGALVERGHRVTSIHAADPIPTAGVRHHSIESSSGVLPVHEFLPGHPTPQKPVSEMPRVDAEALIDAFEATIEEYAANTDVIVAHHANVSTVAAARVARRHHIPYVVFVHGTGIEPRYHGGYADPIWHQIAAALTESAGILVTTAYVRDALVRPLVDVPLDHFAVLPCGVDLERYSPAVGSSMRAKYGLPDRYVICPGAITALKGPQNVAAATAQYADLAPTVFIGDGDLRPDVERALGNRGCVLGFVSDDDKAGLISEATILAAAPEKREHFGIIYVEALAGGTVPVAYRGGGVDSVVTADVGVLTERTPAALGSALRTRLEQAEETRLMADRARRRAVTHFDASALAHRFVRWVEGIAEASPVGGRRSD